MRARDILRFLPIIALVYGGAALVAYKQGVHASLQAMGAVESVSTSYKVVSPENVDVMMAGAKAGDQFRFSQGNYGHLALNDRSFTPAITFHFAEGAFVEKLTLTKVQGLKVENLSVEAGKAEKIDWVFAVSVLNSQEIIFSGGRILWSADQDNTNDGKGMTIRQSRAVKVQNMTFNDNYRGVVVRDSDDITLRANMFDGVRSDGINVSGGQNIKIINNECRDFYPLPKAGDHPDCIQFWNDTANRSNQHVEIIGNNILKGQGGVTQGIFISGQKEGFPNKDFTIKNNMIEQGMGHAIMIHRSENMHLEGNTITPSAEILHMPGVTIRPPVADITLKENKSPLLDAAPGVDLHLNLSGNIFERVVGLP